MPAMGSLRKVRRPEFAGIRMWRVKYFESYLIFYFPWRRGIYARSVVPA
jgi:hypothetical protein